MTSHKSLIAFQKCDGHTYNTCCHLWPLSANQCLVLSCLAITTYKCTVTWCNNVIINMHQTIVYCRHGGTEYGTIIITWGCKLNKIKCCSSNCHDVVRFSMDKTEVATHVSWFMDVAMIPGTLVNRIHLAQWCTVPGQQPLSQPYLISTICVHTLTWYV